MAQDWWSVSFKASIRASTLEAMRRIGSFKTDGSAHIIAFVQNGDEFTWNAPVGDVASQSTASSSVTQSVTVPAGVICNAYVSIRLNYVSAGVALWASPLDVSAVTSGGALSMLAVSVNAAQVGATPISVRGNTSGQFRVTCNGTGANYSVETIAWFDRRGK
jgi:hypothetical protein